MIAYTRTPTHFSSLVRFRVVALTEETHRNYLDLAIRGHSENISHASRENADASCLTSSFLRVCAFAALQGRSLNPYTPPTQWLRMTHGTGRSFHATWHRMSEDETSIAMRVLNRPPILTPFNEALWAEDDRQDLEQLLQRSREDVANKLWNSSIQEAYNSTLSYVSAINIAIAAEEAPGNTCRELIAFLMLIPKGFTDLVEEHEPRALVVLAYYFVLVAMFRDMVWWVGDAGGREIRGIPTI